MPDRRGCPSTKSGPYDVISSLICSGTCKSGDQPQGMTRSLSEVCEDVGRNGSRNRRSLMDPSMEGLPLNTTEVASSHPCTGYATTR